MITGDQAIMHAIGDYVTQSDWMANEKTKRHLPAICHALVYSLPFWFLRPSLSAWLIIFGTHFFIDRYRLARYVVWGKNFLAPRNSNFSWAACRNSFGYPPDRPVWLACWLTIIADNVMHICINAGALRWL